MSENQKHQDTSERESLNFVLENITRDDCFGMTDQQYNDFQNYLKKAEPNQESNEFPDFVFDDGFIEHFAITSSVENKKGAKQKRESTIFKKKSKATFFENLEENEDGLLASSSYARPSEEHSYDYLIGSIKKNWEKHIKSYERTSIPSKQAIFLLEYMDVNIHTATWEEGNPAEVFDTYRISGDKTILEWIYSYKNTIDYLILMNDFALSIEVIRIENIPNLIEKMPNVKYASAVAFESHKFRGYRFRK